MPKDFVEDLPNEQAQPWEVVNQEEFIAIIQWDGTGEHRHWILIPKTEVEEFITQVRTTAQTH